MLNHFERERCEECGSVVHAKHITQCQTCASYVCGRCGDGDACVQCREQLRRERGLVGVRAIPA